MSHTILARAGFITLVVLFLLPSISRGKYQSTNRSREQVDTPTTFSWSLLMKASAGDLLDSSATFGVQPDATPGYDPNYDVPRPPDPPGNYIELYFPHSGDNWPTLLGLKYMKDFNSPQKPNWLLKLESTIVGATITLSWDMSYLNELPQGYMIKMRDSSTSETIDLRTQSEYSLFYQGPRTFFLWIDFGVSIINVAPQWNIISLPRIAQDSSKLIIFPQAKSEAFAFEGVYFTQDKLENGKGYWLKFDTNYDITIVGIELPSLEIPVVEGWNLIGTVDHNILAPTGGVIISDFFGYEGSYSIAETLKPGKGYWVKANSAGTIMLGSAQLNYSQKKERTLVQHPENTLTINDQEGGVQVLYLCKLHDDSHNESELPPLPPTGMFDTRFSSNKYREVYNSSQEESTNFVMKVQSINDSISIMANIVDPDIYLTLYESESSAKCLPHQLISGEPLLVNNNSLRQFNIQVIRKCNVASEFILKQNYPNPWNPTTFIEYVLPERSYVLLRIFDLLGKEITRLVNEIQDMGLCREIVTTSKYKLSSGIYYYKLDALGLNTNTKYSDIKKFIYLK